MESLTSEQNTNEASKISRSCTVRLPKLELKKFGGQVLKWQEFWDTFEATIHMNPSLQPIDKFNYLRAELENEALKSIAGLELTNANYEAAISILKERYGNTQLILDTHYTQLMEMPPAINKTASLRTVFDRIEQHLRSLQSLGEDINHRQIISLIRNKLPRVVIARIEQQKDASQDWTVEGLRKALKAYISAQEIAENQSFINIQDQGVLRGPESKGRTSYMRKPFGTADALLSNERYHRQVQRCLFCEKNHWSDECRTISTLQERKEKVKGKCYICLRPGHVMNNCKVEKPCFHCKKRGNHHRSLCPSLFEQKGTTTTDNALTATAAFSEMKAQEKEVSMLSAGEQVIMQTALVEAMDIDQSRSETTRIMMDTGSQRTYVTEDIVKKLGLQPEGTDKLTVFTFGANKPKSITTKLVSIVLKSKEGNTFSIKASVVPQISGNIQRMPIQLNNQLALQRKYRFADTLPKTVESSTIGLLIGSDYYNEIMSSERIKIQEGLYVIQSKFGWMISGRTKFNEGNNQESTMLILTHSSSNILQEFYQLAPIESPLQAPPNMEEFWKLETIGITPPDEKEDNGSVMKHFNDTVKKVNGRYQVTWPWRNEDAKLPENFELSLGRLKSLYKRIGASPELLQKYNSIIQDQLEKGIIERIKEESEQGERRHYIPHHAILTPEKETTKIRIVYDASAKTKKSNLSLNECLHRGPVILEDLCGLIMRFRTKKIGMIADIEKAFLQVALQPKERDVTRFLWLKDVNKSPTEENIDIYRFTRVPFGIVSSPFLLGAVIKHHFSLRNNTTDTSKDIYVDNLITGAESKEEAQRLYCDTKEQFAEISMNLRDWNTNSKEINQHFPEQD